MKLISSAPPTNSHGAQESIAATGFAFGYPAQMLLKTLTVALGHTVIFQGWNGGNPGNRDKPAARVLGGVSQECLVSAFLQLFCQLLVLQVVLN